MDPLLLTKKTQESVSPQQLAAWQGLLRTKVDLQVDSLLQPQRKPPLPSVQQSEKNIMLATESIHVNKADSCRVNTAAPDDATRLWSLLRGTLELSTRCGGHGTIKSAVGAGVQPELPAITPCDAQVRIKEGDTEGSSAQVLREQSLHWRQLPLHRLPKQLYLFTAKARSAHFAT